MEQLKWSTLTPSSKDALLAKYEAGMNLEDDANLLNMQIVTLGRRIREWREFMRAFIQVPEEIEKRIEESHTTRVNQLAASLTPIRLTDIKFVDARTDQQLWVDCLHSLQDDVANVTVMHGCDIHFPFADFSALEVWYKLVAHTQPHVIVVGSDSADFSLLSSFKHDADTEEEYADELETFEMFWRTHIQRIKREAPNTQLVFIYGNHEYRILRFLNDSAPKLRKTVMKAFKDIIRCDGRVMYIGETDYIRMGPIVIQHGKRTNQYPVKSSMLDLGNQLCTQFGHVHRLDEHVIVGEIYTVRGWSSGKLSLPPRYIFGKVMKKEQIGTTIMEVNLKGREVDGSNLLFLKDEETDIVSVRFERQLFEGIF